MATAYAKLFDARISPKHSSVLGKELRGKNVSKAKEILEGLISGRRNIDGRRYVNASKKLLEVLNAAEANARIKNLDAEKLFVKNIKTDKASKFMRPRSLWHMRGQERRSINILIEIEER